MKLMSAVTRLFIWILLLYCIEFYYQIFYSFKLTSNDAALLDKETFPQTMIVSPNK